MKPNKNIQRNTVNTNAVKFKDLGKSGFRLGFSSQISGTIGKLIPAATQWVMPGDRVSGGNSYDIQFEPLAVPMVGRLNLDSHNFLVKMRNIYGNDWMDFMSVSQGRSEVTALPTWNLRALVNWMLSSSNHLLPNIPVYSTTAASTFASSIMDCFEFMDDRLGYWNKDYKIELKTIVDEFISSDPATTVTNKATYIDWVCSIMYRYCDHLIGEGSMLDVFGYPILDHRCIRSIVSTCANTSTANWSTLVTDMPVNDVCIRANYYIWYCFYRNIYTEPRIKVINPRKWTATALGYDVLFKLIVPMYRNWNIDLFTGAQIDDISRHVYAGIPLASQEWQFNDETASYVPADAGNFPEMQGEGIVSQDLQYIDTDGQVQVLTVKVPSIFGSTYLNSSISDVSEDSTNLPLLQLRRAKMLERYLKRLYFSGDLYTDYVKAQFDVDLNDALVNQPIYLGGSSSPVDVNVETNNTTTSESPAGQKAAVMSAHGSGDGFNCFVDEFGVIINIVSMLPECSYDTMPNQHLYTTLTDFPLPVFSQQDDELSHRFELSRSGLASAQANAVRPFAHHPYKHDWRGRVNDFHGNALSTRKMYNFGRLFDLTNASKQPIMNAEFLHCKPSLEMFISSSPLNDLWFGYADHKFDVERSLSAVIEEI